MRSLSVAGYVFFSFVPLYLYLKPRLTAILIILGMGLSFSVTRLAYPVEWESIWCWSGMIILMIAIAEPYWQQVNVTQTS